jgi:hypothetical protein
VAAPTRIYADFNGLVQGPRHHERTAVVLDTFGSVRDLSNAGLVLKEGLPLIAVDESDEHEDLEGHGTAQFDQEHGWWVVEFDELGVRYVSAGDRRPIETFTCVGCRKALPGKSLHEAYMPSTSCPHCGTNTWAALAPPSLAT